MTAEEIAAGKEPAMQTEPEQWAAELEAQKIADAVCGDYAIRKHSLEWSMCKAAALSALRAFEGRERKLREEYEAEHISLLQANYTLNSQLADYALKIRQALKETPDAG